MMSVRMFSISSINVPVASLLGMFWSISFRTARGVGYSVVNGFAFGDRGDTDYISEI